MSTDMCLTQNKIVLEKNKIVLDDSDHFKNKSYGDRAQIGRHHNFSKLENSITLFFLNPSLNELRKVTNH